MKVLIFGSDGQLGRELKTFILDAIACGHTGSGSQETADISSPEEVDRVISRHKPDVIINAAAMTNVDMCEDHKAAAYTINGVALKYITRAARFAGAYLIQVSTDYVFDGTEGNYTEDSPPNPINYYGLSKLVGDTYVNSYDNSLIVRTSGVFGHLNNFPKYALETLRSGNQLNVIDGFYSPIHSRLLAKSISELTASQPTGFLNVAGERTTRIALAERVAQLYGLDEGLIRTSAPIVTMKARRPFDSSLKIVKAQRLISFDFYSLETSLRLLD